MAYNADIWEATVKVLHIVCHCLFLSIRPRVFSYLTAPGIRGNLKLLTARLRVNHRLPCITAHIDDMPGLEAGWIYGYDSLGRKG